MLNEGGFSRFYNKREIYSKLFWIDGFEKYEGVVEMKKALKSALSLMLALALVVSVLAIGASAARPETVKRYKNYMSIGDSVGSGFGLPGYNKYGKMVSKETLGQRIEDSYPDKVADFTGAKLTQRCLPGTTCASWRYWLDDSYTMTEWEWEEMQNFSFGFYDKAYMQNMRSSIRKSVREADLITIDIGLNDTWYPAIALVYYIAEDGSIGPFDPRTTLEEELAKYGTWTTVARNAMYMFAGIVENPTKWAKYVSMLAVLGKKRNSSIQIKNLRSSSKNEKKREISKSPMTRSRSKK